MKKSEYIRNDVSFLINATAFADYRIECILGCISGRQAAQGIT